MTVVGRLDQYGSMIITGEFDDYSMSENLLLRSNSFNTAGTWTPVSTTCVFAQNVTGPDGVANSAWTIDDQSTASDGAGFEQTKSITPSTTTNYCLSIFIKQGTATILDFYAFFIGNSTKGSYLRYTFSTNTISVFSADGGGITPTIYGKVSYPNGWIRIYFVVNDANNGLNNNLLYRIYPASRNTGPIGTTLFYGAQLETGSVPTDYTPTTTTAINRILPATTNTNITGLGTYYSSGFYENVGVAVTLTANVFMRQNTDKSVIVYNEINEIGLNPSTVTPSTTSLNEGSSVTFNVTSDQLSTTLFWTLNPISGSITTSDFVGLATTGSFATNDSGVGSTTLTLANDLSTEGTESFQLQVRTGSTSGTISTTSSTITVLDTSLTPQGQQEFTTPGTFNWTVPDGVTSVSVVCIGGGGGGSSSGGAGGAGGGGGGLGWENNIPVTPGASITVQVGSAGIRNTNSTSPVGGNGGDSFFISTGTVAGFGGGGASSGTVGGSGGSFFGTGGGNGGSSANSSTTSASAGGGAGGYSGNGGSAVNSSSGSGDSGSGGGGGAGGRGGSSDAAGAGGGVGLLGQGANGSGGANTSVNGNPGFGGSGGADGSASPGATSRPSTGGAFGGGGGGAELFNEHGPGGGGAVRIMWGGGRSYPSNAANV